MRGGEGSLGDSSGGAPPMTPYYEYSERGGGVRSDQGRVGCGSGGGGGGGGSGGGGGVEGGGG